MEPVLPGIALPNHVHSSILTFRPLHSAGPFIITSWRIMVTRMALPIAITTSCVPLPHSTLTRLSQRPLNGANQRHPVTTLLNVTTLCSHAFLRCPWNSDISTHMAWVLLPVVVSEQHHRLSRLLRLPLFSCIPRSHCL